MQFFYVDPGLRSNLGHHANSCRMITCELRQRGIHPHIFAHNTIDVGLCEELGATPHFRWWTYGTADFDPIAGWLTSFMRIATDTAQDLARLPPMSGHDVVYLNSSQPPQLLALLQWMMTLSADRRPHVITEFGTGPGLDYEVKADGLHIHMRDPRQDPRAVLYRFAAGLIPALQDNRLHLFTFEAMSSQLYGFLLKTQVAVLPLPHVALAQGETRVGKRPITVSVLGHQRPEKGFALVPEIVELLLASRSDIKLLVHNGEPTNMASTQQRLRELARIHPRLELDERTADPALWQHLLQKSDLILCPYPVWNFSAAYSAVAAEAVAAGIPLVVPAQTTLATLLKQYGGGGTMFAPHEPASIAQATLQAIDQFDKLAEIATRGSVEWHKNMGTKKMVDALLALVPSAASVAATERTLAS